jgi:hypothetical protein
MSDDEGARQAGFRKAFNVHGYGLQYSVAAEISRFRPAFGSPLHFVGAEVPVSIGGKETHADFVFQHGRIGGYLIGECKKSDRAFSEWCFAPSGLATREGARPVLDQLHYPNGPTSDPHDRAVTVQ